MHYLLLDLVLQDRGAQQSTQYFLLEAQIHGILPPLPAHTLIHFTMGSLHSSSEKISDGHLLRLGVNRTISKAEVIFPIL